MAAGLGFKDFVTGEVLTAADVDGYLMQGVWVFASAAARDAAVTSPQEGNFAYLKDTNVTTYYTGSAWANLDTTGMTNPMTTTGDTIYSSSGSTPARLGIGSTGQVLTVAGGVPSWATPAAGGGGLVWIGNTSFSATTSITVNNVFSTTYDNYRIIINSTGAAGGTMNLRLRVSGTDSTSSYSNQRMAADGTTLVADRAGQTQAFIGDIATLDSSIILDCFQPFLTKATTFSALNACNNAGGNNQVTEFLTSAHNASTSYTGFSLLPANNNTGTVSVYGYAKA